MSGHCGMRKRAAVAALFGLLPAIAQAEGIVGSAIAQYFGMSAAYIQPDGSTDVRRQGGFDFVYGMPLNPNVATEVHLMPVIASRRGVAGDSTGIRGSIDLVLRNVDTSPGYFFLAGVGALGPAFHTDSTVDPFLDVGGGVLIRTGIPNLLLRGDARLYAIHDRNVSANRTVIFEESISVGVQIELAAPASEFPSQPMKVVPLAN